jgi:hypothetical protein
VRVHGTIQQRDGKPRIVITGPDAIAIGAADGDVRSARAARTPRRPTS